MVTSKFISSISYNTDYFLVDTLNSLLASHDIEFYAYIHHLPEEDENKEHIHLFIIPSKRIDTSLLCEKLCEPDLNNPEHPLRTIHFRSSKFVDWYLYGLHDIDYLLSKGETRIYHYGKDDFIVSDTDYLNELIHTSDFSKYKCFSRFREAVQSGATFNELYYNGFVPTHQIYQYEKGYYRIREFLFADEQHTERNGHSSHEDTASD